jgi:hypothetical protein
VDERRAGPSTRGRTGPVKQFEKRAAQHQLLQEAAVVIARREGPEAITRRGLSAELGTVDAMARRTLGDHVLLPTLAATECAARRRRAALFRSPVERLLPEAEAVDVEVVWLRLLLGYGTVPPTDDGAGLPQRYELVIRDRVVEGEERRPREDPRSAERTALAPYLADRVARDRELVVAVVGERTDLAEAVHALVDGLVLAICTGRLAPEAARTVLADHLDRLGVTPAG